MYSKEPKPSFDSSNEQRKVSECWSEVVLCSQRKGRSLVDMGLGHPRAWGDTAEQSHPSHHGGLDITLPVNLPREARGLAAHLMFSFPLETLVG